MKRTNIYPMEFNYTYIDIYMAIDMAGYSLISV